jgi:hypothetical protein
VPRLSGRPPCTFCSLRGAAPAKNKSTLSFYTTAFGGGMQDFGQKKRIEKATKKGQPFG